jgi:NAD(P)-dependent dehydrogenase (short-subunit alcohol dehydrogenase family)
MAQVQRVAVVTGVARKLGIGRSIVKAFLKHG